MRRVLQRWAALALAATGCQLVLGIEDREMTETGIDSLPDGSGAAAADDSSDGQDSTTNPEGAGGGAGTKSTGTAGIGGGGAGTGGTSGGSGGGGSGGTDGSSGGAGGNGDGGAGPCDSFAPLGEPQLVTDLPVGSDGWAARLSNDGLTAYLTGAPDETVLLETQRETLDASFQLARVLNISPVDDVWDANATETADALTLYFDRGNPRRIWRATRTNRDEEYADPVELAELNSGVEDFEPYVVPDGSALYFVSSQPHIGNGKVYEIYWVSVTLEGKMSVPEKLEIENWPRNERAPVVSSDQKRLYLASDMGNDDGEYDIWIAHRDSVDDPFDEPKKHPSVSSDAQDFPSYITDDECELYLSSDRAKGSTGVLRVHRAVRAHP